MGLRRRRIMKSFLRFIIIAFLILSVWQLAQPASAEELIIANFEGWPNNLGGEMGVYGSLSPDWTTKNTVPYSWVYERKTPGYDMANVKEGKQSFRLVNGLGAEKDCSWGSFGMDLGKTVDLTVEPKEVKSLDASEYKYLVFWIKGEKGGEKAELTFRDAHSIDYMPQATYPIPIITDEWQKVVVPLSEIEDMIDITEMVHIGIAFGPDVGNEAGDTIYVDEFMLTDSK
jgi:hypothetical protein